MTEQVSEHLLPDVPVWPVSGLLSHLADNRRVSDAVMRLLDHWLEIRETEDSVPPRAKLSPVVLKPILPHFMLIEYFPHEDQFRFRLIGTGIVEWAGLDNTGRTLTQMGYSERTLPQVEARYRLSRTTGLPVFSEGDLEMANGSPRTYWRLIAPLRLNGEDADLFAVVMLLNPDPMDRFGKVQWPPNAYSESCCVLIGSDDRGAGD